MTSPTYLKVKIDLSGFYPDLAPEALENLTSELADELRELVNEIELVRESEVPEDGKPALGGFVLGLLKAEISVGNSKKLLTFLGDRFRGKTLKLEFKANDREYKLEYYSKSQLDEAVAAIERLSKLT